jgi:predicted ATPase/class 3 adenylate cyclase
VTFLFTDVEGSTRLWEADPRAMSVALARHDALLSAAIAEAGGTVFKTAGDAFCAVFPHPAAAVAGAIAAQRALAIDAETPLAPLKVRMAIHAGAAEARGGDYFGPPLNRVARLLATAHGEQVVVSRAASELLRDTLPPELDLRDLGEHALKDLQHAERVYQVVAAGLRTDFPPLRTPRQLLRNVPSPATPLIGRNREAALARAFLGLPAPDQDHGAPLDHDRPPARLLTLTGPGGAGKTRLALHLASELGVGFGDGAAFVSLAALTDPDLVPAAILGALDAGEPGSELTRELLLEELRDRDLLLVLDNFEQIMDAAPLVADLLAACSRLAVLATSRERLGLRGEQELPLPPLALPGGDGRREAEGGSYELGGLAAEGGATGSMDLGEIRRSEAVRLFVERAQSVRPGFALSAENAAAVVEVCRRLDGLPLAIELAAARAKLLSPQALLERLDRFDRRLDVLSRGARDLPARQQTMRDAVAWSYDLLGPDEQRFFARLAVFVGGATLEACAAVAEDDAGDASLDPLELIESLTDKSLVRLEETDDEPRVTMFETIRDYGLERLAESDERQAIAARHAEWYLRLAEEAEPLLVGSEQARWLDRLEQDQANLRAAIGWLRDEGHIERALRLAGALWRFWWLRGDTAEGRAHLEGLLGKADGVSPAIRAKALNAAGVLAESQGDRERAERLHEESLALSRQLGDRDGIAWSLNNLGVVAINQGDLARARSLLEEHLSLAEAAGDRPGVATALMDLGQIAHHEGDHERAKSLFSRSLEQFRELGNESCMARALNNLGGVALNMGEFARAHELLQESLALHRHVGDRQGIASTLNNLAGAANRLEEFDTAMGYFRESHALALAEGQQLYAAIAMENLAALTFHSGDARVAEHRYREALRLYREVGDEQGVGACMDGLAAVEASLSRS